MEKDIYEKIMDLAKRRGYLWSSFEIYGGIAGFVDYGPLGCLLKNNIISKFREQYIIKEGFYEIESPTVTPYEVLKASGHVDNFTDPIVECKNCLESFRADHLIEEFVDVDTEGKTLKELDELIRKHNIRCPKCGGELGEVKKFNLMFVTSIGPGGKRTGYMRPETAQGIFIQFRRLAQFFRNKLPFGVVQIGKSYRNEISPRQGVIRLREFTQAEIEYFVHPERKEHEKFDLVKDEVVPLLPAERQMDENLSDDEKVIKISIGEAVEKGIIRHQTIAYFIALTKRFLEAIGIDKDKIRFRQHLPNEMAHYAIDCWDAEIYTERFGWIECVGIADRTDYDLRSHSAHSGVELSVFVELDEEREIETYEINLNYKVVGKIFKKDTKAIEAYINNLSEKEKEEFVKNIENDGKVIINIDGKEFEILKDYVEIKKVKKVIKGEKVIPHVIEPSYGIDRITYCLLEHSYREEEDRVYLDLKPSIAPIKAYVLPLVNKDDMPKIAKEIEQMLRENGIIAEYDDSGAIGRRYMRADEIGVPFCITVDGQTLEDRTVTVRERNTREQVRVKIDELVDYLKERLKE
ncbi:glycyl-tRNA synthetase (glyS) [Methanocaldococcus jannaschii DSM 2661]|uniref:Glycine--tRNA ligase n=1 Tax=Methanocaldococcus jannaschii (strain ATCC 43067 / DSM 2661 / JAL-1 / JCM 10045 / NBRC 100440) TaxID=243232 RepID=SYG_METJA|nr:glycine--tRNA ligase [Methanocaldococcus jannaschii]Q57681.1 RecName: Full=Glycine--tRNA ligase; AltName: Full=Glycyl-tRNA synthetase; Short=GlyRS [Methanocaldococcus jannaschii DSM 2661]AAB98213.1 glycyl-tRNA synthetase (glyS) [Methanocaldococcus jannaschii DSM 2661]